MAEFVNVIKCDWELNNRVFIRKHEKEDFFIGSQLIVHESQEAIFFKNGQALETFGPGRHTLTTQNVPILGKLITAVTGGQTPFHCEVYFINKTEQMAIKWGTSTKMEYMEPTYGFPIQLGASGEMCLRVSNGRQLLLKVVGTEACLDQGGLADKFRAFLMLRLKNYLVSYIRQEKISVFDLDEHLERISSALQEKLYNDFQDYGVALERFFVNTIAKPEDNKDYQRFKEIHFRQYADIAEAKLRQQVGLIDQQTKAQQMVIEAEGIARKRSVEGYTYQDERRFDVAEKMAENESAGQFANMGIGLGMAAGVGGAVGSSVGGMVAGAMSSVPAPAAEAVCGKCGFKLSSNAKFCPECGEKYEAPAGDTIECPGCHQQIPQGKFCPECGMKLAPAACPQCGKPVAPGAKFCGECGCKLN